jgi:acetylornithine deacetylase/succinyl-diaminopimelate desuccinylase-like protein
VYNKNIEIYIFSQKKEFPKEISFRFALKPSNNLIFYNEKYPFRSRRYAVNLRFFKEVIMKKYLGEMIASLQKLISFNSVAAKKAVGAPFGKPVGEALDYVLMLSESLGFSTKNLDGYSGYAETGKRGGGIFAVLCHLDVVPFNRADWKHDPLGGEIDGGKLYGRGALDDKGPTVAALYAVKKLMDEGFEFNKNVRFVFGLDEEGGAWKSMDYYLEKEGMPEIGISPDADFPVINSEKGKVNFILKTKLPKGCEVLEFSAGTRANIVPDGAYFIAEYTDELQDAAKKAGLSVEKIFRRNDEKTRYSTANNSSISDKNRTDISCASNAENSRYSTAKNPSLSDKNRTDISCASNAENSRHSTAKNPSFPNDKQDNISCVLNSENNEKTRYSTAEFKEFLKVSAVGKAAHGAHPEQGENAAVKLLKFLNLRGIEPFFSLYNLLSDFNGKGLGIAFQDDVSGALTMNAGVFKTSKDGAFLSVEIDVRYPHNTSKEELFEILKKRKLFSVKLHSFHRPLYVAESDPLVAKLLKAYNDATGERASAASIGGATFARALDYCVAFGPVFPGAVSTIHEADENISLDDFLKTAEIYYAAFKSLL